MIHHNSVLIILKKNLEKFWSINPSKEIRRKVFLYSFFPKFISPSPHRNPVKGFPPFFFAKFVSPSPNLPPPPKKSVERFSSFPLFRWAEMRCYWLENPLHRPSFDRLTERVGDMVNSAEKKVGNSLYNSGEEGGKFEQTQMFILDGSN